MVDLKAFRRANNLTQIDLANYFGIGQGFISQIEKGDRRIPGEYISRLLANPHGWDVSMLTEEKPENPAVENPQERVTIERLFAIIDSQRADINTLLAMIKEKDEQINQLREQLDARKRGTAPDAGNSSSADAV